ncbi:hypothetical protein OAS19_01555 [Altererythrobacter sp.]|nr:hypothetical protein [Altererythrobacter sp.]
MQPFLSLFLGMVFIALAFLLRHQPGYEQQKFGRLGFGMMIMAGVTWFIAAALGFWNV